MSTSNLPCRFGVATDDPDDPTGEDPPDELFHDHATGDDTSLVRVSDGWEIRRYFDGEQVVTHHFDDFERAFAEFTGYAYDAELTEVRA